MAALERIGAPGSRRRFGVDTAEVRHARSFVSDCLEEGGLGRLVDDAVLAVSELFGNAVMHSRGATGVDVVISPSRHDVRIEVRDDGSSPGTEPKVADPTPEDPSGRGLLVVGLVADRWGVDVTDLGTAVWFELDR